MANLVRVRVPWAGSPVVGGGVSTFYFDEAHTGFVADLRALFEGLKTWAPTGVTWTFPGTGDLIDIPTGEISGTWSDTGALIVGSTGALPHSSGVGFRLSWATSGIRNGRRVRGTTFYAPATNTIYVGDGTLDTAVIASIEGHLATFLAASSGNFRVYSRPTPGNPGQENTVIGASCPDKTSWLRSRRV